MQLHPSTPRSQPSNPPRIDANAVATSTELFGVISFRRLFPTHDLDETCTSVVVYMIRTSKYYLSSTVYCRLIPLVLTPFLSISQ